VGERDGPVPVDPLGELLERRAPAEELGDLRASPVPHEVDQRPHQPARDGNPLGVEKEPAEGSAA
jgi:hypothetical protein